MVRYHCCEISIPTNALSGLFRATPTVLNNQHAPCFGLFRATTIVLHQPTRLVQAISSDYVSPQPTTNNTRSQRSFRPRQSFFLQALRWALRSTKPATPNITFAVKPLKIQSHRGGQSSQIWFSCPFRISLACPAYNNKCALYPSYRLLSWSTTRHLASFNSFTRFPIPTTTIHESFFFNFFLSPFSLKKRQNAVHSSVRLLQVHSEVILILPDQLVISIKSQWRFTAWSRSRSWSWYYFTSSLN